MSRNRDKAQGQNESGPRDNPQPEHVLAEMPPEAPVRGESEENAGAIDIVSTSVPASAPAPESAPTPKPTFGDAPEQNGPALPRSGLIVMRRSGGLRFTTAMVTVFRDGRVIVEDRSVPGQGGVTPRGKLNDAQLAELYRVLYDADMPALPPVTGRQNPDAYAYEITARIGRQVHSTEAFDGSIPAQLEPLIRLLTGYMRQGES